jgi:hypothetical protein
MAKNSLKEQIKEMENKNREMSAPKVAPEEKVSFDSWYHQRKDKIAKCHHKEIIMADFKARGLGKEATMGEFDKALALYGVKL